MRKEELEEVARVAAAEALAKRDEIIDSEFDARYHDVNLLMRNYRRLKVHYANVSPETLEVCSICSMRRKTGLMMSHVDKMLVAYEALCRESSDPNELRRWNALRLKYIDNRKLSADDIAEELHVDKRTFHRDINRALEDLAVLLFGIEAIGTWKHR